MVMMGIDILWRVGPLRLDEGLVRRLLIERNKADSFEQRKHCEKALKLPEMTWKHWCRTSESAAETEFRVSATLWEVRHECVKTDLKLFLQSKFFANPAVNLPSLPFRFRCRNNLSRPFGKSETVADFLAFLFPFDFSTWTAKRLKHAVSSYGRV